MALMLVVALVGCGEQAIEGIEYGAENTANNDFANNSPDPFGVNNTDEVDPPNNLGTPNNDDSNNDDGLLECQSDEDCATPDEVCVEGFCQPPSEPDPCHEVDACREGNPATEYDWGVPASVVTSVVIETDPNLGADINGDGEPNNALGNLLTDLAALLGNMDLNAELADAISSGRLTLGAAWPSFAQQGLAESDQAWLHFLALQPDAQTPGVYSALPESFIPQTVTPRMRFEGAVRGQVFESRPSNFDLELPLDGVTLRLELAPAYLIGDLSTDEDGGISMSDGSMVGAVGLVSIFESLNAYLTSDSCACLGLEEPMIDVSRGFGPEACVMAPETATCGPEAEICTALVAGCAVAVPLVAAQADVDLNSDGRPDAISAMLRLEMAPALLSGLGRP